MKKIKSYLLFLVILLIPCITNASNYKVESYDITIDVSEKREYTYEENINLLFDEQNVSIEKELKSNIKDLQVNSSYTAETKDTKLIKINSGNNTSSTYTFSYSLTDKEYDNDIYEIEIPNTFNSRLNNISFYISLDEDFHKSNIDIYLNGKKDKTIKYSVKNNKIEGTIKELKENDVITIKVDYSKIYLTPTTAIATIIPIVLTLISGLLWFVYGKDLKYKSSKNYELPKNMNSLELGLLNKGYTDEKDVFSLLLELANKGYIKIIENANNDYTLKRLKDYDGKDYKESMFIKSLFRKSSTVSLADYINIVSERKKEKGEVVLDKTIKNTDLYQRFQRAKNVILPISNEKEEKNKYFEKTSERKKAYLMLIVATILILLTSVPFIEINKLYLLPISVIFSIITLYVLINFVENTEFKMNKKALYIFIALAVIILVIMLLPAFRRNRIYLITFLICTICIAAIMFFYKYMPKRTLFGTKQYAKIENFKNFIWSDNKKDYDVILSKNPNYLYDILSSSYVLNLEKDIYRKMKEYEITEPEWFELKEGFTVQKFNNSIERLYNLLKERNEE